MGIQRYSINPTTVTVAASGTQSTAFRPLSFAKGSAQPDSAFDGSAFNYEVSVDGTTWTDITGVTGASLTDTTASASGSYPMPGELFSFPWARIECTTAQTGATTFQIVMSG